MMSIYKAELSQYFNRNNFCIPSAAKRMAQTVTCAALPIFAGASHAYSVALGVGLASGCLMYLGMKDIRAGKYLQGMLKTSVGMGGILSLSYLAYHTLYQTTPIEPPESDKRIESFLEKERNSTNATHWQWIGNGDCKSLYTHPELPGYILKTQNSNQSYWEKLQGVERGHVILNEFKNMQIAAKIVQEHNLNLLVIPKSRLEKTSMGDTLIQERLNIIEASDVRVPSLQAQVQLNILTAEGHFCDVWIGHNAKYLDNRPGRAKLGIYDLDCRHS